MSAIAGIIRFDRGAQASGDIHKMTAALAHRGPDGRTHWTHEGAALGHCLLQTTPESGQERQPLASEDARLVLVMDGRVDNALELRRQLELCGIALRDDSDAELLLQAFAHWGEACLDRVAGDFALAIWDTKERRLFCARDRLGNKPFVYHRLGSTLIFASELHAILTVQGVRQTLNEGVLAEHLACEWYSRTETFWEGILRLPAGHKMSVCAQNRLHSKQYWLPDLARTLDYARDEEYIEHYRELLTETVRRMSRSHTPVACEVSGGLDSSAIFAVADKLRRDGRLQAAGLHGFNLDFHGDSDAGERDYCRSIADWLGVQIEELEPTARSLDWYRSAVRNFPDFPPFPNGTMFHSIQAAAVEKGCRVVFNGSGGDEWLGSGPQCLAEEIALRRWRQACGLVAQDRRDFGAGHALWATLRYGLAPLLPVPIKSALRKLRCNGESEYDRRHWLQPRLRAALDRQREKSLAEPRPALRWPGQREELAQLHDPRSAIALETMERIAAVDGLELRRPYNSAAMVEFSFMVPKRLLYCRGVNRYTHRQALRGLLPESVLGRHCKAEFSVTYNRPLVQLEDPLLREILPRRGAWVDPAKARRMYQRSASEGFTGWRKSQLWQIYSCDLVHSTM